MAIINMVIKGGGSGNINNQDKTITENGSYTYDNGYTGLGTVTVDVPTLDTVYANVNGVSNNEGKKVLVSESTLHLDMTEPIVSSKKILSICENVFCITADGTHVYTNEFNDGKVGKKIATLDQIEVNAVVNGVIRNQIHMNGNTSIITDIVPRTSITSCLSITTPLMKENIGYKHINEYKFKSTCTSNFGTVADKYVYYSGSKHLYVYDVEHSHMYEITSIPFVSNDTNVVMYVMNDTVYMVDYESKKLYSMDTTDGLHFIEEGTVTINSIGLNLESCQESKNGDYIFCKDGFIYIQRNSSGTIITEYEYIGIIKNAFAGVKVHHIQPLYDGKVGFGMEDGRYILCSFVSGSAVPMTVKIFEPHIIENDGTVYHRYFSGYGDYWCIPNMPHGSFNASKTEVKKMPSQYTVISDSRKTSSSNSLNTDGIMTGEMVDDMVKISKLPGNIETYYIMGADSETELEIEGLEMYNLKGDR